MIMKDKEIKNPAPCPFNGAVVCPVQIFCGSCGWKPDVSEARFARILADLKNREGDR